MSTEKISFSFGENWTNYLDTVSKTEIERARRDIVEWLGGASVSDKSVLDIGSGSGIHSLAYLELGARSVHSFDYDESSVQATSTVWSTAGEPKTWRVEHGSILDEDYIQQLGRFDIVYSWGVLHHTGGMWNAVENSYKLVNPGGTLWISLYQKGTRYQKDLQLKQRYNNASAFSKRLMILGKIVRAMLSRLRRFQNPFAWNKKVERGMNVYHDIVDWLGGLPYETATEDEVVRHARGKGFVLERIKVMPQGGCSIYVFSHPSK